MKDFRRTQPISWRALVALQAAGILIAMLIGCSGPTAPSEFVCRTQPRAYSLPDGRVSIEVDTYTQGTPCPAAPIQ
jgi:hypothetical protein